MTVRIVDRRFDSKNKSSVNRSRFIRRFKGQIRNAVANAINHRGVRDLDNGEKIGIPGKDIAEPQFAHGSGGVRGIVNPGNDRFSSGDEVDRPLGGGSGQASQDGEGLDDFVFTLTRDEFLDIFFDDLALPNLVKRQLTRIEQFRRERAGYTQSGVPANYQPRTDHARRDRPAHRHWRPLPLAAARARGGTRRATRNACR